MVKISPSRAGGVGSIPVRGTKTPHASQLKDKIKQNRSNLITNSVLLKYSPHKKKILKKENKVICHVVSAPKSTFPSATCQWL